MTDEMRSMTRKSEVCFYFEKIVKNHLNFHNKHDFADESKTESNIAFNTNLDTLLPKLVNLLNPQLENT